MLYQQTFAQANNLKSGDVLFGPKSNFRVIQHFIVYRGKNQHGDIYLENNINEGVRQINEKQLLKDNPVATLSIRRFEGDYNQQLSACQRADSVVGYKYHLTKFNCEHFANYVQYNTPFSTQSDNAMQGLKAAASVAGIAIFLGILFGK